MHLCRPFKVAADNMQGVLEELRHTQDIYLLQFTVAMAPSRPDAGVSPRYENLKGELQLGVTTNSHAVHIKMRPSHPCLLCLHPTAMVLVVWLKTWTSWIHSSYSWG
jgi:hypothetical protein